MADSKVESRRNLIRRRPAAEFCARRPANEGLNQRNRGRSFLNLRSDQLPRALFNKLLGESASNSKEIYASMGTRYVVITPVRDEEAYLKSTIESMISQTVRPTEWIIVNDGSTDTTGGIIDEFAASEPWIRAAHRANRGFRKSGGGVVEAFNEGLGTLACDDWEFIVKFDGDLSFASDYFEKCFAHFAADPKLGVGGGSIYHEVDGKEILEGCPAFHVRGATKIYRRTCWEVIGSLWPAPGWDTLDEVKANMHGWRTRSFADLHLIHHRVTGSADGPWGGLIKNGRANYISGYHPLFMLAKCLSRLRHREHIRGAFALMYGFITGYLKRLPQVDDPRLISYLRRQQLNRLWGRETIWK